MSSMEGRTLKQLAIAVLGPAAAHLPLESIQRIEDLAFWSRICQALCMRYRDHYTFLMKSTKMSHPLTLAAATVKITPISPTGLPPSLPTNSLSEPYPSSLKNWEIFYCGDPRLPESQVHSLIVLLTRMETHLKELIADAQLGMASPHGYAAFFKSNRNIRKVTAMYQTILDGDPLIVNKGRGDHLGSRTASPRFFCVNEGNDKLKTLVDACKGRPEAPILVSPGIEILIVCPKFWSIPQFLDPALAAFHCPQMINGKFKDGDMSLLLSTTYAYLVQQLARAYDRGMDPQDMQKPTASMQAAVELDARESLQSAVNFGYYAGGMLVHLSAFLVVVNMLMRFSCRDGLYGISEETGPER
ncbi:MAG: hypothetical protein Q9213_003476 [Squamulea squamosa]